ncbi:hypothetical protein [Ruminococcus sp.]|nr:hypothetical protein [Ruminococcus sp.]
MNQHIEAALEIVVFDVKDVITTSCATYKECWNDGDNPAYD